MMKRIFHNLHYRKNYGNIKYVFVYFITFIRMKTIDVRVEEKEASAQPEAKKTIGNVSLTISGIIFAVVLASSIFLVVENTKIANEISTTQGEIAAFDANITKLQSDRNIMAAELLTANQAEIEQSIQKSEAQRYISELLNIAKKYKIDFSGFSYSNGKITTSATALTDALTGSGDAIAKVSNLIRDYRTGTGSIFNLDPVVSVSGFEQKRMLPVEFSVNDNTVTK